MVKKIVTLIKLYSIGNESIRTIPVEWLCMQGKYLCYCSQQGLELKLASAMLHLYNYIGPYRFQIRYRSVATSHSLANFP